MDEWRKKVERIGNLNYPDEARRQQIYGNLRLMVSINSDGSLYEVLVLESSGQPLLDQAAQRIVRLAAPFAPFTGDLSDIDRLEIIRTWKFARGDRLSSNWDTQSVCASIRPEDAVLRKPSETRSIADNRCMTSWLARARTRASTTTMYNTHFQCIPGLSVRPSNATLSLMKNVSPSDRKHHFLIAMPHMADPHFAHTLTYIVEHTANGAMGLAINRPQDLNLADILEQSRPDIEPPALCRHVPIFMGGPVQTDRGFVLHPKGRAIRRPLIWKMSCPCPPRKTYCSPSPTAWVRRKA